MTSEEETPNADEGRRLSEGLGLSPERALWEAMGCIADDEACLRMLSAHIAAAVAAERERLAAHFDDSDYMMYRSEVAAAIRRA